MFVSRLFRGGWVAGLEHWNANRKHQGRPRSGEGNRTMFPADFEIAKCKLMRNFSGFRLYKEFAY